MRTAGISEYQVTLRDQTSGSYVFSNTSVGNARDLTICGSGCDLTYEPVIGHSYSFRVRARNGNFPVINNPQWAYSDSIEVQTALVSVPSVGGAAELALAPPTPNPMRTSSALSFSLPREGHVRLSILDLHGPRDHRACGMPCCRQVHTRRAGRDVTAAALWLAPVCTSCG